MNKNPLVSIVVITYNSAKYVLETLESCKNQTYRHIELIITDDASTDHTVEICEEWLEKNKDRFTGTKIVEADKNSGISPNLNRGVYAAEGKWIKTVAGDDVLLSNCVSDYIDFAHEIGAPAELLASNTISFKTDKHGNKVKTHHYPNNVVLNRSLNHKDQHELTLRAVSVSVISIFFLRNRFIEIGGCDERFPMYEDKPLLFKFLRNGTKYYYLNKFTLMRRLHNESVTGESKLIVSPWKVKSFYPVHLEYVYKNITFLEKMVFKYEYYIDNLLFKLNFMKNSYHQKIISKLFHLPAIIIKSMLKKMVINKYSKQV
jgi:alpha-1,3-rhamnosyltransferase